MTKVAITGGGGFIGQRVVKKLIEKGFDVHGLAFNAPEKKILEKLGAKARIGDIRDEKMLDTLICGAAHVVHIAAKVAPTGSSYDFLDINVRGTHHLLRSCQEHRVGSVILFLTGALLGYAGRDGVPASENDLGKALPEDPYVLSKEMAREIADLYSHGEMRVVSFLPTAVYGPGPLISSNGFTKIINDYLFKSWHFIIGNGKQIRNFVYVDDIAEATLMACQAEHVQGTYILGGENRTMDDFFFLLRKLSGKQRMLFHVPRWTMVLMSYFNDLLVKIRGKNTPSLRPVVDRLTLNHPVDISKIREELDFCPTPLEEGIQQTITWLKEKKTANLLTSKV